MVWDRRLLWQCFLDAGKPLGICDKVDKPKSVKCILQI
jgi:hypothetical protein